MKRTSAIATICLLAGYSLGAAQNDYVTYGQGVQSCGRWIENNKQRRDTHLFTWVVGFVSGAGYASPARLRTTDSDGIAAWIDTHCASHPLESIAAAAGRLVTELEIKR